MNTMRKILVVDDDPVIGKSFDRVLGNKGYAVVHAGTGEEALRKIAAEDYDMMVTDIRMPGMDGIEVAERTRAKRPWMPVVIITGFGTDENEARAKAAGVTEFLRKPLSPDMIANSVATALASAPAPVPVLDVAPAAEAAPARGGVGRFLKNVAMFLRRAVHRTGLCAAVPVHRLRHAGLRGGEGAEGPGGDRLTRNAQPPGSRALPGAAPPPGRS
jgi:CheY-like chemotaxis protein